MARTYDMDGSETGSISERQRKKKLAMNQGPSTPVGIYDFGDGKRVFPKIQPFKIRKIKKGVKGKL